jgi:glycosyltransferase involved in cell wall biosynthesis
MRSLRVGIDGRAFTSPAAGVRRYVRHLVPALLELGEPLTLVGLGGDAGALPRGLEHVGAPMHPPTNLGWTLVGLPSAASRARVDVIHAPAYTAPFLSRTPIVVTIHDVSYERHPEWYPYRRDWLRRAFYRRSARAAAHVLTDSAFSAAEITAAYGIPADRITVAPLGVSSVFAPADRDAPIDLPAGVSMPFLLHVGDLHERRNLVMLTDAVLAARRHFGGSAAVSATGSARWRPRRANRTPSSGSARWRTSGCRRCIARRRHWSIRRSTRGSGCRCSKRWRAGRR